MAGGGSSAGTLDTLTILFTDIVGSTALRADLGEEAAEVVRRAHDSLVAEIVSGHGGRIVKGLGDGFLATFGSAARAVAAAVGIQQGVDALRFQEPFVTLSLRVGISVGDVTVEDADVFGTPVIEAARLCAAAEPGQILATSVVETLAGNRGGYEITPVGDLELKGLPDPVPTVEVGWERRAVEGGVPLPHALAAREGAFPFCGRDPALEALTTSWKRTLHAGTKSCVLIAGEPGMGKTRLASEFAQRAHADGALVLFGRCDEELGISYQPFVEALAHHAAHLDAERVAQLGAHPAELTRLVPDIATRFPGIGEHRTSGDPEVDQYRLFEAVDAWLATAGGPGGLVLVLDDIHWAARPTLLMLRHILRSPLQSRLLIVATYRDTDLDRAHPLADVLADLRRVPEVERLPLVGIDRAGVEDLMVAVNQVELDDRARALAVAVHDETEGNPFFVGELFRHLAESGALVQEEGGLWRLAVELSDVSLPDGIREVVGRRLSRLSEPTNDVLSWAAVVGRELRLDVLAAVTGDQDRCLDAIDEAVDARLVDEVAVGRWRFSHALVRATLLAELRTTRKVRMHVAVGEAYERLVPDDIAALAQHFSEAAPLGSGEKAVGYLVRAGGDAVSNLAFDEAADLYRRALDIVDDVDLDIPELTADAAIGLAIAHRWSGREYHDDLARAFDLAASLGDGTRMARVLLGTSRGFTARVFAVDEVLVAKLEQCLEQLGDEDSAERVRVTAALAQELAYSGDVQRLLALTDHALEMGRRLDDPLPLHEALSAAANLSQRVDLLDRAPALVAELTRNGLRLPTPIAQVQVVASTVGLAGWTGDRAQFQDAVDQMAAAGSISPQHRWLTLAQRVGFELRWGTLEEAERLADEMAERANETGEPDAAIWFVNLMGFTHRQAGRYDEALALFEPVMALDGPVGPIAGAVVAMIRCEADRHDDVRAIAEGLYPWARAHPRDQSYLPNIGALALAVAELGDLHEAAWMLDALEPLTAYWSCWSAYAPIAPVPTIVGRLRAVLGDYDGAEDAFTEAVAHCRSSDARFFLADALLHQGLARRDAGQVGEAVTAPITEALRLSEAGGHETLRRRAAKVFGSVQ